MSKLALGLVIGLLDYGNALYYGLPNKEVTNFRDLKIMPQKQS